MASVILIGRNILIRISNGKNNSRVAERITAVKCLSGICVATVKANIELLILEQRNECSAINAWSWLLQERERGMKVSRKGWSRNEVAELSVAELIRLIHIQLGTLGSRRVDSKVPEIDGSPHGEMLLFGRERTDKCPSSSKDAEEEVVWRAFTELDLPGKV